MHKATSPDGTQIAFTTAGNGQNIVIVLGALNSRKSGARLAKSLSPHFTVTNYDRRGRGSSTDTAPYAVAREVEDLRAVLDSLGGDVHLYGHSSGAAVVLQLAAQGHPRLRKLAIYEAPYVTTEAEIADAREYNLQLLALLAAGNNSGAVALFISHVGVSDKQIAALKLMPMWKGLVAMASTLAYDSEILGNGHSIPHDVLHRVEVPSLVMHGSRGAKPMAAAASEIAGTIPNARLLTVEGQDHGVSPKVVAPLLEEFFSG